MLKKRLSNKDLMLKFREILAFMRLDFLTVSDDRSKGGLDGPEAWRRDAAARRGLVGRGNAQNHVLLAWLGPEHERERKPRRGQADRSGTRHGT